MQVEFVAATQPRIPDLSSQEFTAYIARIGRVKSNPERLLKYLIEHAHWSPFEHTFLTFKISTSRAMGRELLRHRSFTFQELSQRYEKILSSEPVELRRQSETNRQSSTTVFDPLIADRIVNSSTANSLSCDTNAEQLRPASACIADHLQATWNLYQKLIEAGVARECARAILPECTTTTILMTGSLRSWIHFFAIRDHELAQKEIQEVARAIRRIFTEQFPVIAQAIAPTATTVDREGATTPIVAEQELVINRAATVANTFTGE